jgi:ferredoxin
VIRVRVDAARCQGHTLCHHAVPEVFGLDEEEHSRVDIDEVPADLEERVRGAALDCPEGAIRLICSPPDGGS